MVITKKCNRCLKERELESFYKDKAASDGRYSICNSCKAASVAKWRRENKEEYNATIRRYRHKHRRRIHLKLSYGITPEDYNALLIKQNGQCAICEKQNMSQKRPLAVDHSHVNGKIRGLLCYGCNRALSTLERPGLLQKAMQYLLR